jgi:hypothetical protein
VDSPERRQKLRFPGSLLLAGACLPLVTAATPRPAQSEAPPPVANVVASPLTAQRPASPVHRIELTSEAATVLFAMAHRTADDSHAAALFAPSSWYTPPPPPAPVAAPTPAAPTAPPLPFAFVGRYTDGNGVTVYFVTRDDRVYDVKPGDTLDATYSIEAIENDQLVFLYKPLNTRQPLAMGEAP